VVTLTFPAYTGQRGGPTTISGRVHSFPAVATKTSRGASVVKAEIRVDDPPEVILPGYSFTGEIEIQAPQDVVLVERSAIAREDHETYAMRLLPDGTFERVTVEVTPYGRDLMRIVSGLAPGDVLQHLTDAPSSGQSGGIPRGGVGGITVTQRGLGGPRR
jgi:multidrug efflux pump subunit AcrA (membrane-fusion protein)